MNQDILLSNIARYIKLTPAQEDFVISLLQAKTLTKKEFLLRQGETCRYDHFVTKGCLKVCYTDDKGVECIIKFAPENWWVVDLDSFLNNKPSFYYIQAIEETEVLQLSRTNYELLYQEIPQFQKFSSERWQNGFIALQQRIMQNLTMTAEERYEQFLRKYPGLQPRIPQKLVAAYLGITPEFLSMLRRKWAMQFS